MACNQIGHRRNRDCRIDVISNNNALQDLLQDRNNLDGEEIRGAWGGCVFDAVWITAFFHWVGTQEQHRERLYTVLPAILSKLDPELESTRLGSDPDLQPQRKWWNREQAPFGRCFRSKESPFQVIGPTTGKERFYIVAERVYGATKLPWAEKRSLLRPVQEKKGRQSSCRYMVEGAQPDKRRRTKDAIL